MRVLSTISLWEIMQATHCYIFTALSALFRVLAVLIETLRWECCITYECAQRVFFHVFHWPCAHLPGLRNFFEHIIYHFRLIWSASTRVQFGASFPSTGRSVHHDDLFNLGHCSTGTSANLQNRGLKLLCFYVDVGRHLIRRLRLISSIQLSLFLFSWWVYCAARFAMLRRLAFFFFNELSYFTTFEPSYPIGCRHCSTGYPRSPLPQWLQSCCCSRILGECIWTLECNSPISQMDGSGDPVTGFDFLTSGFSEIQSNQKMIASELNWRNWRGPWVVILYYNITSYAIVCPCVVTTVPFIRFVLNLCCDDLHYISYSGMGLLRKLREHAMIPFYPCPRKKKAAKQQTDPKKLSRGNRRLSIHSKFHSARKMNGYESWAEE